MKNDTHPYTFDIVPSPTKADHFLWVIRKHGKLLERSDRLYRSEAEARKSAEKAIERQFADAQSTR